MSAIYQRLVDIHGFSAAQKIIISLVKNSQVLEIGSSAGYMTAEFKKNDCQVDIVEIDKRAAKSAKKFASTVFQGSLEDEKLQQQIIKQYDIIVCADVLEHLVDTEGALKFLKKKLKKDGWILISVPNIACWEMRLKLLQGNFEYEESGLLDKTHLRFYTYNTFLELLTKLNFKIIRIYPAETRIPLEVSINKIPILGKLIIFLIKPIFTANFPNLSFNHYVVQTKI